MKLFVGDINKVGIKAGRGMKYHKKYFPFYPKDDKYNFTNLQCYGHTKGK